MTAENLRISLVQVATYWESPEANRAELEEMISAFDEHTDLFILPETFTTGFTSHALAFAEPLNFTTHRWLRQLAARKKTAICGSFWIKEGSSVYNRFFFVEPDGQSTFYDKKHLFSIGGEQPPVVAGEKRTLVLYKGWQIRPIVCYDLRFPIWCRNEQNVYDLLLCVANWPAARQSVWDTLLKARAIENQAFAIGVNRVGSDGSGIEYAGGSAAFDAKGNSLLQMGNTSTISSVLLNRQSLIQFREKFPVWQDADRFELK